MASVRSAARIARAIELRNLAVDLVACGAGWWTLKMAAGRSK